MSILQMFKDARFIKTAVLTKDYPVLRDLSGDIVSEIAVAGRSNVGKSSLLNHLFQSKGLVKTSSTPGKTQALNFFMVGNDLAFVDLPGYGFAEVPIKIRKEWGPMVQTYLKERSSLKLILFLFDIRRKPNEDDKNFLEWAAHHEKAVILVFTKCDKLKKNERKTQAEIALKAFNAENLHHVYYSVEKNIGHKELRDMIQDALKDEGC
ncbi:MAG TPA: ribosome biogenesis GTP-binding protein YihA/YsxC [Parachlamydiaceae bacterium]|nr:ribosome biogenesis GTP-binding protein YihA/YsxC [Parachlamydiaceae bacterium]